MLPRGGAPIDVVVIDGYVFLDGAGAPGLGAHLHAALQGRYPVVGVAKSQFGDGGFATPVLRGSSRQPLWSTAIGMDVEEAARCVVSMHGPYRIPTLLTWVDRLAAGRSTRVAGGDGGRPPLRARAADQR